MDKISHLTITEHLSCELNKRHKFFLKLGSILPDLLVYTYISGHTWAATFDDICQKMVQLECHGKMNCYSFLKLGYIIHYIEDYFTFPHNAWFNGSVADHVKYEKAFAKYLRSQKYFTVSDNAKHIPSAAALQDFLSEMHRQYAKEAAGFANDLSCISEAAASVLHSYIAIFKKNQQIAEGYSSSFGVINF
ncbi:MAG: zinc dependent phospholipase C family protein [Clostridiaceae bacterium]|nr:zinc dependent phospholipase C family protein [Clostridiaceae bacterium]